WSGAVPRSRFSSAKAAEGGAERTRGRGGFADAAAKPGHAVKRLAEIADTNSVMSGTRPRAIGLVVLAVVVALGAGFLLLGRGGTASNAAPRVIKPLHPVKKHGAASRPAVAVKRKKPSAVVDGMPRPLAAALSKHPVVVVSLYQQGSSVDDMAKAEARF